METDRRRFTLTRIVSAAVALVVLALVFQPLFCQRQGPHPSTVCLSHVKQLSGSLLVYASDHGDRLPSGPVWMDATHPYSKPPNRREDERDPDLFRCPIAVESSGPEVFGYAFNLRMSRANALDIENPEKAVVLYDSTNLQRNATDPMTSLPRPGRHRREGRGANILGYLDGHVKVQEYGP